MSQTKSNSEDEIMKINLDQGPFTSPNKRPRSRQSPLLCPQLQAAAADRTSSEASVRTSTDEPVRRGKDTLNFHAIRSFDLSKKKKMLGRRKTKS